LTGQATTGVPLVFLTGASGGIGQALAARYAAAGWRLALVARRVDAVRDWAAAAGVGADRALVLEADVAEVDSIVAAGRACLETFGLPDVVIANAGISVGVDTAIREDLEVFAATMATNVTGVAATFHPFVAPMRERRRGTLVGVASVAAIRGMPGHGAYCASKAAVLSYCESLRGECRASGVRVVALLPGYVRTPMTARNRYPMPFIVDADGFAERALRAIEAGDSRRVIPWPMAVVAKLLRLLPDPVFDRLLADRARKARRGE
jgi:short-subunit dehydrogenase